MNHDNHICDLLHETHNLTHDKISNIISTTFHADLISIIHTSVRPYGFYSMLKNNNHITINNSSDTNANNYNYFNDEIFLYSLNSNKPIIIKSIYWTTIQKNS